jgi:multiple antibiotic resistance protein
MNELLTFALTVFTGFFAIMNPIANVPIFMSLVQDADEKTQRKISRKATVTAFLIVLSFVILGKFIFHLFGITIPAFKITGGILIFYVGFEMMQSKKSSIAHPEKVVIDENIAVSPLAIPILAGPGTIVTAMNFAAEANYLHIAIVIFVFALMCLITAIAFNLSDLIVKKIGENIIVVIGKIMGLILAIIGTTMITEGLKLSFEILKQ